MIQPYVPIVERGSERLVGGKAGHRYGPAPDDREIAWIQMRPVGELLRAKGKIVRIANVENRGKAILGVGLKIIQPRDTDPDDDLVRLDYDRVGRIGKRDVRRAHIIRVAPEYGWQVFRPIGRCAVNRFL